MIGNAIPDIPRLYTALAEWLSCMVIVLSFKPAISRYKVALFSVLYLGVLIAFMELTATVVLWLWLPCMLVAFFLMTGFVFLCTKANYYESVYYAVLAFSTAECIASIEWQIIHYTYRDVSPTPLWAEVLVLVLVYGILVFIEYQMFNRRVSIDSSYHINKRDWFTAIFIAAVVFMLSNLRFVTDNMAAAGQYSREIATARTLVDIAGVAVLYAHYVSCRNEAIRAELEAVQNTLQSQYQQYKQSRESIDLINMKYHDLKHQIGYLRDEPDANKRNAFLNRLENDIKSFELQNKTGNAVLDTILTSKSLYCYKHGITMTCVADGKLLDFMEAMDICSIFGNALDNAIESVLHIKDKEKRLIHVTVSQLNDFVMIRIENYYEDVLQTDGENYLTTKRDKRHHGWGIKSIKYTAHRYDGAVYINADNNWFDIKIAIPKKA
ncbi:MAG: sensor histidine kinase [Ruminococcaceae bacterium]|nr:sensor histidine kinase [Oscillospiraceae bacterium]